MSHSCGLLALGPFRTLGGKSASKLIIESYAEGLWGSVTASKTPITGDILDGDHRFYGE